METNLIKIGKAAEMLGISVDALRNLDKTGNLCPVFRSHAGTRYYTVNQIREFERHQNLRYEELDVQTLNP